MKIIKHFMGWVMKCWNNKKEQNGSFLSSPTDGGTFLTCSPSYFPPIFSVVSVGWRFNGFCVVVFFWFFKIATKTGTDSLSRGQISWPAIYIHVWFSFFGETYKRCHNKFPTKNELVKQKKNIIFSKF